MTYTPTDGRISLPVNALSVAAARPVCFWVKIPCSKQLFLLLQAAMYQNIGNISVVGVTFDSNVATGSGGGLYQNSFAGEVKALLHTQL